jgi:hypothetical protein
MGLLTPKGKKDNKKGAGAPKPGNQGSKFIANKNTKGTGGLMKKNMTGGSQRGS